MKNIVLTFLSVVVCFCFNSCKQQTQNDKIKNGIEIYEDGLHVEKAFLTNSDSTMISDDNKVQPGERVCLRMIVKGWKEKDNKIFMDASQKVSTSSGVNLVNNPSIFGITLMYGTVPAGADHILLYQTIGRLNKPVDYILISFKVWDKTSGKSVWGSYKLQVQ